MLLTTAAVLLFLLSIGLLAKRRAAHACLAFAAGLLLLHLGLELAGRVEPLRTPGGLLTPRR